jgi:putative ABC transport system ATP-binding protein
MQQGRCGLPEQPLIVCRAVSHVYRSKGGSVEALHGVDFAMQRGAVAALVGPSGSGKSTLLRLLAGLDVPRAGTIMVDGRELTTLPRRDLRRHRRETVSYIAQPPAANLIQHLTLREQLRDPADLPLVRELGIEQRLDATPEELAGGEQARAALAVGLSRRAPLVLIDEPTAELDRRTAERVIDVLGAVCARGRSVVVATHDPDLLAIATTTLQLGTAKPRAAVRPTLQRARSPAVVAADGVTKRYGGAPVIEGISLRLAAGELGVVLGRSGSGKSTLMMVLGGWIPADAGSVRVPGTEAGDLPRWSCTSYVAQRFALLAELSVAENVELPLRLAGGSDSDRVTSLLELLDLSAVAHHYPGQTSIGQQQRTALARALVTAPAAVLADEPTSHQDVRSADRVWTALADASTAGTACLVATHDDAAAERADRLWRLTDGRLAG